MKRIIKIGLYKNVYVSGEIHIMDNEKKYLVKGKVPMSYCKQLAEMYYMIPQSDWRDLKWIDDGTGLAFAFNLWVHNAVAFAEKIKDYPLGVPLAGEDVVATRWEFSYGGEKYDPSSFLGIIKQG